MVDASTLSYFPHRSSSTYLDTSKHPNPQGISESTSTLTLLNSKSITSDMPNAAVGATKATTFSSASNLQQKLFANKVPYIYRYSNYYWQISFTSYNLRNY